MGQRASAASLSVIQNWEGWLTHHRVLLTVRGALSSCRNGPTQWTHEVKYQDVQSPAPERNNPMHQHRLGTNRLESSLTEGRGPGR